MLLPQQNEHPQPLVASAYLDKRQMISLRDVNPNS